MCGIHPEARTDATCIHCRAKHCGPSIARTFTVKMREIIPNYSVYRHNSSVFTKEPSAKPGVQSRGATRNGDPWPAPGFTKRFGEGPPLGRVPCWCCCFSGISGRCLCRRHLELIGRTLLRRGVRKMLLKSSKNALSIITRGPSTVDFTEELPDFQVLAAHTKTVY